MDGILDKSDSFNEQMETAYEKKETIFDLRDEIISLASYSLKKRGSSRKVLKIKQMGKFLI
jgi:hypothetical protein